MGAIVSTLASPVTAVVDAVTSLPAVRTAIFNLAWLWNKPFALYRFYVSAKGRAKLARDAALLNPGKDAAAACALFKEDLGIWAKEATAVSPAPAKKDGFVQVGGHANAFDASGGQVKKVAGKAESSYYENIKAAGDAKDAKASWPSKFMPKYFGLATNAEGKKQVILENILAGYQRPCILDLKMGTETVDSTATTKKIFRMMKRDVMTCSAVQGTKLVAMNVYQPKGPKGATIFEVAKKQAEKLGGDMTVAQILAFYMCDGETVCPALLQAFTDKLTELLAVFEEQKHFLFIGSSLLFVYEGCPVALKRAGLTHKCDMRMIDFAHVFGNQGRVDAGYLSGLRFLLSALGALSRASHLLRQ